MSRLDSIMDDLITTSTKTKISVESNRISYRSAYIRSEDRYQGDQDNIIVSYVSDSASESFDINTGLISIDRVRTKMSTLHRVKVNVLDFLFANMQQKLAKETKLYKFFRALDVVAMSQQVEDILVELVIFINDSEKAANDRVDNGLKVCKFIYTKFA